MSASNVIGYTLLDIPENRRDRYRFSMPLSLVFIARKSFGTGQVVNISSKGVLFTTVGNYTVLAPGRRIMLKIDWPVLLDGKIPVKLHAEGYVVRVDGNSVAMRITTHEFRTFRLERSKTV